MSAPDVPAQLKEPVVAPQISIDHLFPIYEKYARALDPFSAEADQAEKDFFGELNRLYDELGDAEKKQLSFEEFRRFVVRKCKRSDAAKAKKYPTV